MPQIAPDWYGSLFTGNDNAFFASSSSGFRFTNVPLDPAYTVTRAALTLGDGSIAFTSGGTWSTVLEGDAADGSDFSGLTRAAFLARFDGSPLVNWQVEDIGATRPAESPDLASIINARIHDPGWQSGGAIVVGVLNNVTVGRAEVGIVKSAYSAVLHIEWSTGAASSTPTAACADDSDGDGYSDVQEMLLGKDPNTYCAAMRADVDGDRLVSIRDLAWIAQDFGEPVGEAPARYDQGPPPRDGIISISDLARPAAVFGRTVTSCP